jgi:hypothetical protein
VDPGLRWRAGAQMTAKMVVAQLRDQDL